MQPKKQGGQFSEPSASSPTPLDLRTLVVAWSISNQSIQFLMVFQSSFSLVNHNSKVNSGYNFLPPFQHVYSILFLYSKILSIRLTLNIFKLYLIFWYTWKVLHNLSILKVSTSTTVNNQYICLVFCKYVKLSLLLFILMDFVSLNTSIAFSLNLIVLQQRSTYVKVSIKALTCTLQTTF